MPDWGVYLDGNSVVSDTCLSLQEYLQNPVNTTLNTVLPCAALAAANATYRETRIDIDSVIRTVHSLNPKNLHFPTYWSFLSPSFSLLKFGLWLCHRNCLFLTHMSKNSKIDDTFVVLEFCSKTKHSWPMHRTSPVSQACVIRLVQHLTTHILAFALTTRFLLVTCKKWVINHLIQTLLFAICVHKSSR